MLTELIYSHHGERARLREGGDPAVEADGEEQGRRHEELRSACLEADAKLYACQMTVDLLGYSRDDFIPEVAGWVGAASFLPQAQKSDVSLFI